MSDQQEIAALREDLERKLKHQEALQKGTNSQQYKLIVKSFRE